VYPVTIINTNSCGNPAKARARLWSLIRDIESSLLTCLIGPKSNTLASPIHLKSNGACLSYLCYPFLRELTAALLAYPAIEPEAISIRVNSPCRENKLSINALLNVSRKEGETIMNAKGMCRSAFIGLLTLFMSAPPGAFGQGSGTSPTYQEGELEQMLAPIALYPDSLLAQVLVAATYPLEVVQADRWVRANKNLKGEKLNAALDKMDWDLSVKALVPFPEVLAMMSDKLDWTQKLGDAFVAQESDVMNTIQKLRSMAQAQGNLRTTREQKVIVQQDTIVIEPASPTVVYVPAYNPAVVYGAWAYPAYPPYPYYPAGAALTAGVFGFAAGVAVGAAWNNGWGSWNWHGGTINANINRNVNINRSSYNAANIQTGKWKPDPAHRKGVPYRDAASRQQYGRQTPGSAQGRRDYRGYGQNTGRGGQELGRQSPGQVGNRPSQRPATGAGTRPAGDRTRQSLAQRQGGGAFQGMGSGKEARMSSDRGASSRQMSSGGFGGGSSGGRQSYGGSSRGGGGFQGGGSRGGGGGRGGGGRGGRR
jgi:hypothetical protein